MEDSIKKLLYAGVGFANSLAKDMTEAVEKMTEDSGPLSEQGKKIVDDFMEKTKEERESFKDKVNEFSSKVKDKTTASADNSDVITRLEKLEEAVFGKEK